MSQQLNWCPHFPNDDSLLRRRQREYQLSKKGLSLRQIAGRMGLATTTVRKDLNIIQYGDKKGKKK